MSENVVAGLELLTLPWLPAFGFAFQIQGPLGTTMQPRELPASILIYQDVCYLKSLSHQRKKKSKKRGLSKIMGEGVVYLVRSEHKFPDCV